ncbi:hypothetical protein [Spiroplasma endosymbiont of Labia minor]|uniref:hypothetical protein n=1 Tax=Spiroplasma endosymbiont of Labia minor TaxID=3066305 RepID=UPI0030D5F79E
MKIDKVKLGIKLQILPILITYVTTRHPSFFEYLIIEIILNHPDKNKKIIDILRDDFKISKIIIFDRVIRNLLFNKVINYNEVASLTNKAKGIYSPLSSFNISAQIVDSFKEKKYTISVTTKNKNAYLIYNPINKEITMSLKDLKTNHLQKYSIGYLIESKLVDNLNQQIIINQINILIKNNEDIFGGDSKIVDASISNLSINKNNNITIAKFSTQITDIIDANLEVFTNKLPIITTDDAKTNEYINNNRELITEISIKLVEKYNLFVESDFASKRGNYDITSYSDLALTLNDISNTLDSDILFINNDDVISIERILKNYNIVKNINYIIIYNSKVNNKRFDFDNNRTIIYLNNINDKIFNLITLGYLTNKNKLNAYGLLENQLRMLNLKTNLFFEIKDSTNIDLSLLLSQLIDEITESFYSILDQKAYDKVIHFYQLMMRVNKENELDLMIENYLKKNISNSNEYNLLREGINRNGSSILLNKIEIILTKIGFEIIQKDNANEIVKFFENYKFTDSENIILLSKKAKTLFNFEQVFKIANSLQINGMHSWRKNLFNCSSILLEYFNNSLNPGEFHNYVSKSKVYNNLINFCDKFGLMYKMLLLKQFDEARKQFNEVYEQCNLLFELIPEQIQGEKRFLISLWNIMSLYYKQISEIMYKRIETKTNNSNKFLGAFKILNNIAKLTNELKKYVPEKFSTMQVEFLYQLAIMEEKTVNIANKIISSQKINLIDQLKLAYGNYEKIPEEQLNKIISDI